MAAPGIGSWGQHASRRPTPRRPRGPRTTTVALVRTSTGTRLRRLRAAVLLSALVTGMVLAGAMPLWAQGTTVGVTTVQGAITPVVANHLADAVDRADRQGLEALVVQLDTPGGLVTSTRDIVQTFLNAPLPVIVHVTPRGADAGSAGTFVTLAAHVAAMAPATTIGAATPVDMEGAEVGDKIVENAAAFARTIAEERGRDVDFAVAAVRDGRSITATEALEVGAIDLIVADMDTLLAEVDGTTVEVRGDEVTLATADAAVTELDMPWTRRILQRLADPNLAFVFMSIGTLAIVYEVANPGLGAGGIIGAVMLILAFFALSVLPFNYAGLGLLILAGGLFIAELFAPGIGVGAAGGTIALVLGALFLFDRPSGVSIDLWVLVPTVIVVFVATILAGRLAAGSRHRPVSDPTTELVGRETTVHGVGSGDPRTRLDGTSWRVRLAEDDRVPLSDGDTVVVVAHDNLDLIVAHPRSAPTPNEEQT